MTTPITGRCLCGAVHFSFPEPPIATRACWCRDCQYLASGNATVNAIFRTEGFELEGETAEYLSLADSGNRMRRRFCPCCGTALFGESLDRTDVMVVRVGALDDREPGRPGGTIWTGSAPSWGHVDATLPSCPAQPGPVPKG